MSSRDTAARAPNHVTQRPFGHRMLALLRSESATRLINRTSSYPPLIFQPPNNSESASVITPSSARNLDGAGYNPSTNADPRAAAATPA